MEEDRKQDSNNFKFIEDDQERLHFSLRSLSKKEIKKV